MKKLAILFVVLSSFALAAQEPADRPEGPIVPVYHEPHHRMLFAYGTTKILEGQIPPGDMSWFHVHAEPILYITLSGSQQQTQVLGQDWSSGRGRGAPGAGRGAAAGPARGSVPAGPPVIRATSTTSYFEQPVTHRIRNIGNRLFRFMVVTNASAGDEGADTPAQMGFADAPELTNRWFRAYRITLAPGQATPMHRHMTESVIVQISDGQGKAIGPMTWELGEQGRWAWFDAGKEHEIRNVGSVPFEAIEVEVRHPAH